MAKKQKSIRDTNPYLKNASEEELDEMIYQSVVSSTRIENPGFKARPYDIVEYMSENAIRGYLAEGMRWNYHDWKWYQKRTKGA